MGVVSSHVCLLLPEDVLWCHLGIRLMIDFSTPSLYINCKLNIHILFRSYSNLIPGLPLLLEPSSENTFFFFFFFFFFTKNLSSYRPGRWSNPYEDSLTQLTRFLQNLQVLTNASGIDTSDLDRWLAPVMEVLDRFNITETNR